MVQRVYKGSVNCFILSTVIYPGGYRPPLAPRPPLYPHHLAEEAKKEAQSVPSVADKVSIIIIIPFFT